MLQNFDIIKKYICGDYYIINDKINVVGSVHIKGLHYKKLPVVFGNVTGDFDCSDSILTSMYGFPESCTNLHINNTNITSLLNSPKVSRNYDCASNKLITLEGCQEQIYGAFICRNNFLRDLQYAPIHVEETFDCHKNFLTTLKNGPKQVGSYICSSNNLIELDAKNTIVNRLFYCSNNKLQNLINSPVVGGSYICENNELTSLQGVQHTIHEYFNCSNNKLTSLKNGPTRINGVLKFNNNPIKDITETRIISQCVDNDSLEIFAKSIGCHKNDVNLLFSNGIFGRKKHEIIKEIITTCNYDILRNGPKWLRKSFSKNLLIDVDNGVYTK